MTLYLHSMCVILPYQIQHKEYLMRVFDSNVPHFFDRAERKPFENFLLKPKGEYFVVIKDINIQGSGGYFKVAEGDARISWLMIDFKLHGKGLGKQLMELFEKQILLQSEFDQISLKTTQKSVAFYSKLGYQSTYFEKNHWAKGLDLYSMVKSI